MGSSAGRAGRLIVMVVNEGVVTSKTPNKSGISPITPSTYSKGWLIALQHSS